jgi:MoxR-like ATPase
MSGNNLVNPIPQITKFDDSLSPLERLRGLADRLETARGNEHGVGYHVDSTGQSSLVFSDIKGEQVVYIPTRLSRESFNKLMSRVLPLEETKFMLHELAKAYDQRTPIMLEGGTAIGKTYVVNLFAKLMYGEKAKIPDFYCNGQTDVSELLGKYVPAGIKPEEQKRVTDYLESEAGKILKAEILKETGGQYEFKELYTRAAAALGMAIDKTSFEFQLGALPRAMTAGHNKEGILNFVADGPGVMLHIQEVGMAAPSVVNALLQIRGEQGRITDSIQIWQDGGREIKSGPGFFVVFSTNPPGKGFQERFEVDKALARGLVWLNLPDQLSDESLRKAASKIFSFKDVPPQHSTVIDISRNPELGQVLGGVVAKFHKVYTEMVAQGEPGRKQKVPPTIDSMWRVAELVQEVQVLTPDGKSIDMVATLKKAISGIYVNCLQSKPDVIGTSDKRAVDKDSLGAKLLSALNEALTNEAVSKIQFRGSSVTPESAIKTLTQEALFPKGASSKKTSPEIASVAEVKERAEVSLKIRNLAEEIGSMRSFMPEKELKKLIDDTARTLSDDDAKRFRKQVEA